MTTSSSDDNFTQFTDITTTTATAAAEKEIGGCLSERYWFYFLASSLIVFLAGLVLILLTRLLVVVALFYCPRLTDCASGDGRGGHRRYRRQTIEADGGENEDEDNRQLRPLVTWTLLCSAKVCCNRVKRECQALLSGHSIVGRILVSLSCLLSIGSLVIYLFKASLPDAQVETCDSWSNSLTQQIDFAFNMFFLVYFIIRFLGADDKFFFWIEINSFVDYFTIPPVFVGIALNRQWLGLRFLRAIRLINIPDILQYLRILKTGNLIRLAQLLCIFTSVWFASAGFVHLLELSGDPFRNFDNAQNITFWECVYFVVVTMATVGYGDVYCHTTLGRIFIVVFIFGALAMFASFIPEIAELIQQRRNAYGGYYEKSMGVKHVVVTGHITYHSVKNFLRDFFHEDRDTQNVKSVFIDSRNPELNLEALFKRHVTRLVFIKGSVMNIQDLQRVRLHDAEACMIMSDASSSDPDSEDAVNIMKVISVKNFDPNVRIIVQIICYRNKALCINQPSWTSRDQVICLSELKLGFMATGCLAPGFSTLIGNLVIMLSYKQSKRRSRLDDYQRGTGMEVYCESFSKAFYSKTFQEVAKFCYDRLNLLLVAVTTDRGTSSTEASVVLNPGNDVIITSTMKGFFIGQSEEESKRVLLYCPQHHGHLRDLTGLRRCACTVAPITSSYRVAANIANWAGKQVAVTLNSTEDLQQISLRTINGHLACAVQKDTIGKQCRLWPDGSGYDQTFQGQDELDNPDSVCLRSPAASSGNDADAQGPQPIGRTTEQFDSTGFFHWCPDQDFNDRLLTNDSNNEVVRNLDGHVVLCCFSGVADSGASCAGLGNFVMPLRASNLHWEELRTIVIVGEGEFLRKEWPSVCNFPKVYLKLGSPLNRSELRYARVNRCHMCVVLTNKGLVEDPTLQDKESILCTLNIKTMKFQCHGSDVADILTKSAAGESRFPYNHTMSGASIPILTELANDLNVQFLDQDDDDDPETPLYMTQPFASGRTFVASVLDTLMITAYFNRETLSLIRNFVNGGDTRQLEYILAEGSGLIGGQHRPDDFDSNAVRDRCRVNLLPLGKGVLAHLLTNNRKYGTLLLRALDEYGILCLGVYRLIATGYDSLIRNNSTGYRYVITNPPRDFHLHSDDMIYCLEPFRRDRYTPESDVKIC